MMILPLHTAVCIGSLSLCTGRCGQLNRTCGPLLLRIHPATSSSKHVISKHQWHSCICSCSHKCHHNTDDPSPFSSHHPGTSSFWIHPSERDGWILDRLFLLDFFSNCNLAIIFFFPVSRTLLICLNVAKRFFFSVSNSLSWFLLFKNVQIVDLAAPIVFGTCRIYAIFWALW